MSPESEARRERRWDQRAFVVTGAIVSGVVLPLTGLADHASRHVAGKTTILGWAVVHTTLGIMLVVFCSWHAVLNRRALLRHVRGRHKRGRIRLPRKEAVAALALVGAVLAVTVAHSLLEA